MFQFRISSFLSQQLKSKQKALPNSYVRTRRHVVLSYHSNANFFCAGDKFRFFFPFSQFLRKLLLGHPLCNTSIEFEDLYDA